MTASLGMATAWAGCDGDELLREADQQLYVVKHARHDADAPAPTTR